MTREELRGTVREMVKEAVIQRYQQLSEARLRNKVHKFVNESLRQILKEEEDTDNKRTYVLKLLRGEKGNKYNYAELARKLWHPKDKNDEDTYRSLFSKKLSGKPDNDGAVRSFEDWEINKLYELIRQQ